MSRSRQLDAWRVVASLALTQAVRSQREQQWVKAAKSAVAAHSGFFFELMNSSNRRIRELCILILGAVEK